MANIKTHKTSTLKTAIHPRVTDKNATFLKNLAKKNDISYSQIVNGMINAFRKKTTYTVTTTK